MYNCYINVHDIISTLYFKTVSLIISNIKFSFQIMLIINDLILVKI